MGPTQILMFGVSLGLIVSFPNLHVLYIVISKTTYIVLYIIYLKPFVSVMLQQIRHGQELTLLNLMRTI